MRLTPAFLGEWLRGMWSRRQVEASSQECQEGCLAAPLPALGLSPSACGCLSLLSHTQAEHSRCLPQGIYTTFTSTVSEGLGPCSRTIDPADTLDYGWRCGCEAYQMRPEKFGLTCLVQLLEWQLVKCMGCPARRSTLTSYTLDPLVRSIDVNQLATDKDLS